VSLPPTRSYVLLPIMPINGTWQAWLYPLGEVNESMESGDSLARASRLANACQFFGSQPRVIRFDGGCRIVVHEPLKPLLKKTLQPQRFVGGLAKNVDLNPISGFHCSEEIGSARPCASSNTSPSTSATATRGRHTRGLPPVLAVELFHSPMRGIFRFDYGMAVPHATAKHPVCGQCSQGTCERT